MADGVAVSDEVPLPFPNSRSWQTALNTTAAILISAVFLVAGLWKITDPNGAAARLAQAKVPEALSIPAAVGLGILETFAGVMLLVPRFRRWGAWLGSFLLLVFMIFIAAHYSELRGADCSCFPWIKRAVGPGFFIGDASFIVLALGAGIWARSSEGIRPAAVILGAVAVFALVSWGVASVRNTGTKAPASITAENGQPISLQEGKVFLYFFNPQCLHCLEAGRRLAALNWGTTRFIGVPTENPQFGDWFMGKAGLTGKGPVSKDIDVLKNTFHFETPPVGVALENGREKKMLLQFEDKEPFSTLQGLGFVN